MKIEEKKDGIYINVSYNSPIKSEGKMKWVFKDTNIGEFIDLDVDEKMIEGLSKLGQATIPVIYLINSMMTEGEKITKKTPTRIFGYIRNELKDFLT